MQPESLRSETIHRGGDRAWVELSGAFSRCPRGALPVEIDLVGDDGARTTHPFRSHPFEPTLSEPTTLSLDPNLPGLRSGATTWPDFSPPASWTKGCDRKNERVCAQGCLDGKPGDCEATGRLLARTAPHRALPVLDKACRDGQGSACSLAGDLLLSRSLDDAAKRYAWGCSHSDSRSCFWLGALEKSQLLKKPPRGADVALYNACQLGEPGACRLLGMVAQHDPENSFRLACEQNDRYGCFLLGDLLFWNQRRMPEARAAFEKACRLGDSSSCRQVGRGWANAAANNVRLLQKGLAWLDAACDLEDAEGCEEAERVRKRLANPSPSRSRIVLATTKLPSAKRPLQPKVDVQHSVEHRIYANTTPLQKWLEYCAGWVQDRPETYVPLWPGDDPRVGPALSLTATVTRGELIGYRLGDLDQRLEGMQRCFIPLKGGFPLAFGQASGSARLRVSFR